MNDTIIIKKDGDQWCASWADFTDLQNSPAFFGDSPLEALSELLWHQRLEEYQDKLKLAANDVEVV